MFTPEVILHHFHPVISRNSLLILPSFAFIFHNQINLSALTTKNSCIEQQISPQKIILK